MAIERPASDYLHRPVFSVAAGADLEEAEALMRKHGVSDLLVVDEAGAPAGVISRTDLLRVGRIHARGIARPAVITLPRRPIGEIMTKGVVTLPPSAPLAEAARLMVKRRIHRVFIGTPAEIAGVISTHELLHAIIDARIAAPLSLYMSTPVITVSVTDPLWLAADGLGRTQIHGVVAL